MALLRRIHEEGTALLLATTREDVAAAVGGRVLRLEDGRVTHEATAPAGPPEAAYLPPAPAGPAPVATDPPAAPQAPLPLPPES